ARYCAHRAGHCCPTRRSSDLVEAVLVEQHPAPTGPFGAKGAGEPSIILTAPAVANAIRAATGVTVAELPMTAEVVHRALRAAEADRKSTRLNSSHARSSYADF